jgi:ankyrin repeat protein
MVERLVAAGADVDKADTDTGATALFIAAQNGDLDVVELLIAAPAGVDVNKARFNGSTPLSVDLKKGHADVA